VTSRVTRMVTVETGTEAGRPMPGLIAGICELTLQARDLSGLARFYQAALGCEMISEEGDRIWLSCGPRARLGIWAPGAKEFGDRGGLHVHFAVSASPGRLDAVVEHWRALGLAFHGPVAHPGADRSVYLEDPEGNVLEVWDFFEHGAGAAHGVDALG
jgi:catechol-2,3-dioxygenase